ARIATGRVVDPEGSPLEGVYVAGVGSKTTDGIARSDWESTLTDHEGLFKLSELHQQVDHQLFLQKDQYGTRVYDFPADEKDENQIDYGDLILHPGGRIEGILRSQAGAPIPGHQVKLRGANQDLGRFRPGAQPLANTWVTAVRESRTDSQGRFFFQDLPEGEFRVTAAVQGRPGVNDEETVQLIEGGHVAGIALELNLGKPIKGIVLTPEGLPAIGVFVQVANAENRIKAPTGSNGNFELFGVTDEMETVDLFTVVASYNWHNPTKKLAASELVQARPGDTDIVIKLREIVTLTGRVETDEGQPIPNIEVRAYLHGTPRIPGAVLAKDTSNKLGLFRLDLPEQCFVDLVADAPQPEGAEPTLPFTQKPVTLEIIPSTSQNVTLRFSQ
ncbi:MAG: carboxypeptidase-like regulatory domain-containing protein, partial [Planctomycetes bacterium]|nr:carboxypeptidase-like regulatory domain-containing protein [Planctomycetota bacterium]